MFVDLVIWIRIYSRPHFIEWTRKKYYLAEICNTYKPFPSISVLQYSILGFYLPENCVDGNNLIDEFGVFTVVLVVMNKVVIIVIHCHYLYHLKCSVFFSFSKIK